MDQKEVRIKLASLAIESCKNRKRHLILRTFTGSGKTTSVVMALVEAGFRVIYCAPNHDVIDENINKSAYRNYSDFLHLEGKQRSCIIKDYETLIKRGYSINDMCVGCSAQDQECQYKRNIKIAYEKLPNLAITHSHLQNFLPKFLSEKTNDIENREYYDALIIDENPMKVLLNEMNITFSEISFLIQCLRRCNIPDNFIRILEELQNNPINYDKILEIGLDEKSRYFQMKTINEQLFKMRESELITDYPDIRILNFLYEIYKRINGNLDKMIYWYRGNLNLTYFDKNALKLGLHIIGLDGTANSDIWRNMLGGEDLDLVSIDYTYEHVYQFNRAHYPATSWYKSENTQDRLCNVIDEISKREKRKVLVVGVSKVIRIISKKLKTKNHMFAKYYALRSKNEYWKECDTVILACEPHPPKEKITSAISVSGWEEKIWNSYYTKEEMLQACGRLRQLNRILPDKTERPETKIIIFPSTLVDKNKSLLLPEARVIPLRRLITYLDNPDFWEVQLRIFEEAERKILMACPTTKKELESVVSKRDIRHYFNVLILEGMIVQDGKTYKITEKGRTVLTANRGEIRENRS